MFGVIVGRSWPRPNQNFADPSFLNSVGPRPAEQEAAGAEGNTICKNTAGGVLISAKGNPVLSGNSIHGNPTAGVLVSGGMGIIARDSP